MDKIDRSLMWLAAALIIAGLALSPDARAQFWQRGPGDFQSGGRMPRTYVGPQMGPCIYFDNCRGPRYFEDPEQGWRTPHRMWRPSYGRYYRRPGWYYPW